MAFGNNRGAQQPRATVQTAGGITMVYAHPFLIGQVLDGAGAATTVGEIDCSRACKLNELFLDAEPNQDSSFQDVLVDGSVIAMTNSLLNGTLSLSLVSTTGLVATGDLIAALQLIVASKDSTGGYFKRIKEIDGKVHTRLYYGVTVKRVPHDKVAGNAIPTWNTQLLYAGFIDAVSDSAAANEKVIWAVGSQKGVKGVFSPYDIQDSQTGTAPIASTAAPTITDSLETSANEDLKQSADNFNSAVTNPSLFPSG